MGVPVGLVAVCWVAFVTVLFVLPTAYPVQYCSALASHAQPTLHAAASCLRQP
jgi:hypothetical protein